MTEAEFSNWKIAFFALVAWSHEPRRTKESVRTDRLYKDRRQAHEKFMKALITLVNRRDLAHVVKGAYNEIAGLIERLDQNYRKIEPIEELKSKSPPGVQRLPKPILESLIQVLEHAKGNKEGLDWIYNFFRARGEYQCWFEKHFTGHTKRIELPIPNRDPNRPTDWANHWKRNFLRQYIAVEGQPVTKLSDDFEDQKNELLKKLRRKRLTG